MRGYAFDDARIIRYAHDMSNDTNSTPTPAADCQGSWASAYLRGPLAEILDHVHGDILVCTGCRDIMVIIGGKGFDYPAGWGVEDAARSALDRHFNGPRKA